MRRMTESTDDTTSRTYTSEELKSKLRFTTYSDAKLAELFLANDFPVVLFTKVFDFIRDPAFKADELTFEDVWDMLDFISARRRKDAAKRAFIASSVECAEPNRASALPGVIPPVVLDMVVDKLLEERVPLGVAAMEIWCGDAFAANMEPFHNMSLVHRSWTPIVQRGLRQRAVVPYQYITKFLLSPLCGPWINEMIIYWSIENGSTKEDIWLLEALLGRTPNLRSLAFNTSLTWQSKLLPQPPFDIDLCIEIIADLLPNLEKLWLKHRALPREKGETCSEYCCETRSLCQQISKLRSLKFLSLRSWTGKDTGSYANQPDLDWDRHPPPSLTTLELDSSGASLGEDLKWLVTPRDGFCLQSLSIIRKERPIEAWTPEEEHDRLERVDCLQPCIPELRRLRICTIPDPQRGYNFISDATDRFYTDLLCTSSNLSRLDLFVMDNVKISHGSFFIPVCLEHLAFHFFDDVLLSHLQDSSEKGFFQDLTARLPSLPRLQSILITGSRKLRKELFNFWDLDVLVHDMNANAKQLPDDIVPNKLSCMCRERNVQLRVATEAFPRPWKIPRSFRHDLNG